MNREQRREAAQKKLTHLQRGESMNVDKALSLAITCVNNSDLDALEKNEVGTRLIELRQIIDLVRYREFDDSEILDLIDKIIKR